MARISFQVRRQSSAGYSTLRYDDSLPPGTLVDYDQAPRADGLQIAPEVFVESYFETNVAKAYGEVNIEWDAPLVPFASLGGTPEPTQVVLIYSTTGEPETVASGTVLVEASDVFSYDHKGLEEGVWAYYGLFLRYQSTGGDDYYEKAASLSELTVKNYGSTLMLWDRIPPYYRLADTKEAANLSLGPIDLGFDNYGDPVGPLLRYLSIVGYDIDRQRTIVDYLMVSRDPHYAHGEVLDALAAELGVSLSSKDLGTSRLRLLMDDVGAFRRAKGTEQGTLFYIEAVTGTNASIDTAAREVTIYSQRANLMPDPRNLKTPTDYTEWRPAEIDEFDVAASTAFSEITFDSRQPQLQVEIDEIDLTGTQWSFIPGHNDRTDEYDTTVYPPTPPGAVADQDKLVGVLFRVNLAVTAGAGDTVSFSVHSGAGTRQVVWARLTNTSNGNTVVYAAHPTFRHGAPFFDLTAPEAGTFNVEYLVDLRAGNIYDESRLMIERNHVGPYFDGSFTRGGWLTGGIGASVKDFRWSGTPDNSPSLYHEEYERTSQLVVGFLNDVLPVDVAATYTIVDFKAIL